MLSNAIALAALTTVGCMFIYSKLPARVRKYIEKYSLLTDILALLGIYWLLGGTLTALLAGAMCGIMISAMLHIANNKNDYLYLYDVKDYLKQKMQDAKESLNHYGQEYREKKAKKLQDADIVEMHGVA